MRSTARWLIGLAAEPLEQLRLADHNRRMPDRTDNAGVIAPPPLIALIALLAGLALDWLVPISLLSKGVPFAPRLAIGLILVAAGLALAFAGRQTFTKAGTNVEPWKPALVLVNHGVFGWVRNPMYAGVTVLLFGLALAFGSTWVLLATIVSIPVLHFGVVRREERYLESKFGDAYRAYCATVRRYGLF